MESNRYYLPLESKNLAHYFAKACLCPVNYITNRNDDIQNLFPNYILLSNEKFVQDTNCSLEIVLCEKGSVMKMITRLLYTHRYGNY